MVVCTVAGVPNSRCLMWSGRGQGPPGGLVKMPEAVAVGEFEDVLPEGGSAETVSAVAPVAVDVNMRSGLQK